MRSKLIAAATAIALGMMMTTPAPWLLDMVEVVVDPTAAEVASMVGGGGFHGGSVGFHGSGRSFHGGGFGGGHFAGMRMDGGGFAGARLGARRCAAASEDIADSPVISDMEDTASALTDTTAFARPITTPTVSVTATVGETPHCRGAALSPARRLASSDRTTVAAASPSSRKVQPSAVKNSAGGFQCLHLSNDPQWQANATTK